MMEIAENGSNQVLLIGKFFSYEEKTSRAGKKFIMLNLRAGEKRYFNIMVFDTAHNLDLIKYNFKKNKTAVVICSKGEYNGKPNYIFNMLVYAENNGNVAYVPPEEIESERKQKVDDFFTDNDDDMLGEDEELELPF